MHNMLLSVPTLGQNKGIEGNQDAHKELDKASINTKGENKLKSKAKYG